MAGACFDSIIAKHLQKTRNLLVGRTTAEHVRIRIGSCVDHIDRGSEIVHGLDITTGMASKQEIYSQEICEILTPALVAIAYMAVSLLEKAPLTIAADIYDYGIMLTGGCALMPGMAEALARETGLRVTVAELPQDAVIRGLGQIIQNPKLWEMLL